MFIQLKNGNLFSLTKDTCSEMIAMIPLYSFYPACFLIVRCENGDCKGGFLFFFVELYTVFPGLYINWFYYRYVTLQMIHDIAEMVFRIVRQYLKGPFACCSSVNLSGFSAKIKER